MRQVTYGLGGYLPGAGGNVVEDLYRPDSAWPPVLGAVSISSEADVLISGRLFSGLAGIAITVSGCGEVRIEGCDFDACSTAVYALNCERVIVDRCRARTLIGPHGQTHRGNFVQLDKCGPGSQVVRNVVDNLSSSSDPEDIVSVWDSDGTADDPILIAYNKFRGGGGTSTTGSGVMLGDGGGSHQHAKCNTLIDTGAVGIGVAGGSNMKLLDNTVYGSQRAVSNVGIYLWNQAADPSSGHEVRRNRVRWTRSDGVHNPSWDGGNVGIIDGMWDDNEWWADLDPAAMWAAA